MGAWDNIARIGVAAGVTGVVAGLVLRSTSQRADELKAQLDARNVGLTPQKREGPSDTPHDNADGRLRMGAGAVAAGSLVTAGVAALAHQPGIAGIGLGAAIGLTGAALLAGTGNGLGGRASHSIESAGLALSASIHASHVPERPQIAQHLPKDDAAASTSVPRPSASELANARLGLMPGTPDHALAAKNAAAAIAQIDWSKPDIVLWMPGTNAHVSSGNWDRHIERDKALFPHGASAVTLDYPATIDFVPSVSTGMESLRLVLAEIARHSDVGSPHRVMLGGHSQGAWIIGDAMATPEVHAMVDRAVLFGNPGLAQRHYGDGSDAKVIELDDGKDPVAYPVADRKLLIDGMRDLDRGITLATAPTAIAAGIKNADLASFWVARVSDSDRWYHDDPHVYDTVYMDGLKWIAKAPQRDNPA
ncbi:MAG: hypothetical protein H7123_04655 [Thermoleophilia bacterium]|nr:hypothetical protein [Thermoleophilia bacterium]